MKQILISALAVIVLAAVGITGYELGLHGSSTPTPAKFSGSTLTGVYANGKDDYPHYYVSIREGSGGTLSGTVNFAYEDGQTSAVLSFTGTAQDGVATLTPTIVTGGVGSASAVSVPSLLSMTYGNGGLGLGECTGYLHFAESESACFFNRVSSNAGQ